MKRLLALTLLFAPVAFGQTPSPYTRGPIVDVSTIGTGTVTSVSVVSANGLNGTVATSTTTPAITLKNTPAASATPTVIGDMVFQATSDTILTVKYKGSDGTVRVINFPME